MVDAEEQEEIRLRPSSSPTKKSVFGGGGRVFRRLSKLIQKKQSDRRQSNFEDAMRAMEEFEEEDIDSSWRVAGLSSSLRERRT